MDLEEAIENLKEYKNIKEFITENGSYGNTNLLNNSIETVLQALENSVSKDIIREKINERQFELQQEYKDFKDDIRLNTLQELYYYKSKEDI